MNNFNWKSLTLEDCQYVYESVEFPQEPRWHQYVSIAFAADQNRVGFWHDVGTGKTYSAYLTANQWGQDRILVVCPKSAISSWIRDAGVMGWSYKVIDGETPKRREKIKGDQQVSIVQYGGLKTLYCDFYSLGHDIFMKNLTFDQASKLHQKYPNYLVTEDKLNKEFYALWKPKGRTWNMSEELLRQNFQCLIFDEMHRCSDINSLQSKICLELSKKADYVIGLSGTPVDKVLLELHAIHKVLDLGSTFGSNFWAFRNKYFEKETFDWHVIPDKKEQVLNLWSKNSLSFAMRECKDLPKSQEIPVLLEPTSEFRKLEWRVIHQKPIDVSGFQDEFSRQVAGTKIKQLTDGFIYLGSEKYPHRLKENPKLEATLEMLECQQKTLVFHQYVEVGEILEETFKKKKIPYVRFLAGQSVDDRLKAEHAFQNDPHVLVAIVQTSGAEGWDGYAASISIFWDIITSPRIKKQCLGRMLRDGQEKETVVLELMIEDSINEVSKENQEGLKTEVQEYMDYVQKGQYN
jgi:SNF2 family DNA or RNA helicase